MSDRDERRLRLEVNCASEPIAGTLCDEDGTARAFAGWLGLAAALEHLLDARSENPIAGAAPVTRREEVT